MNKTLLTLVAAAGMLGCAKDAPVYSQRDFVQEIPDGNFYREVRSDAETLKLSFYEEEQDGTRGLERSLTISEPSDSAVCLKKEISIKVYVDMNHEEERSPLITLLPSDYATMLPSDFKGFLEVIMTDDNCDGIVNSATVSYNCTIAHLSYFGNQYDATFSSTEEGLNTIFGNIPYQIKLWHERKGL